jgi:hypothetical protein
MVSTTAEASNGFLQNRIAARAARFVFIERLEQSRRQDHSHVSVVRLDVAAQLESAATGEKNVDDQQIGIDVAEAVHRRLAIGEADNFKTFFAKNPLAHPLRMRTIVGEQDDAHCCEG